MERRHLGHCPGIFIKGDGYMKKITPEKYRCPGTTPYCQAVFTTKCGGVVTGCPSIAKIDDQYVIIGKIVSTDDYAELDGRIGDGETAIEIPADLIDEAVKSKYL